MDKKRAYAMPLLAIDQVLELHDGRIHTVKAITGNEAYFQGHYPGNPIYPGVFTLEAIHQAVRHYVSEHFVTCKRACLVQIQSLHLLSPLRPGDRLEVICQCTYIPEQEELHIKAECRTGETARVALAKLRYVLEKRDCVC